MAISEAQQKAVAKYKAANYEKLTLEVRKGYKDGWKAAAAKAGKSLTQFIVDAVEAEISREKDR